MNNYKIIGLKDHPALIDSFAKYFHERWHIPLEAYYESMQSCIENNEVIPQWIAVFVDSQIIAGLGVIKNDFHERTDLSPNVCALYVDELYRNEGIAGKLLNFICQELSEQGIDTLYLVTDHVSFYEQYDWQFLCDVQCIGEKQMSRMYIHQIKR